MPKQTANPAKEYTELNKASLASSSTFNVYSIIVDATFPYRVSQDRFICSLRVIDPSLKKGESA